MPHDVALTPHPQGRYPKMLENTADSILEIIMKSGRNGITQKKLLEQRLVDRSTAYRQTKKLEQAKKIKIIRDGLQTKYIASFEERDYILRASNLKESIINDFFQFNSNTEDLKKHLSSISKFLGFYFLYIFIESMNPQIYNFPQNSNEKTIMMKSKFPKEFISESADLSNLLFRIRESLFPFGFIRRSGDLEYQNKDSNLGLLIEEEKIQELKNAFSSICQDMFSYFEYRYDNPYSSPKKVSYLEYLEKSNIPRKISYSENKIKTNCKHDMVNTNVTTPKGYFIKRCKKCSYKNYFFNKKCNVCPNMLEIVRLPRKSRHSNITCSECRTKFAIKEIDYRNEKIIRLYDLK